MNISYISLFYYNLYYYNLYSYNLYICLDGAEQSWCLGNLTDKDVGTRETPLCLYLVQFLTSIDKRRSRLLQAALIIYTLIIYTLIIYTLIIYTLIIYTLSYLKIFIKKMMNN